jgi:hypothetical protein
MKSYICCVVARPVLALLLALAVTLPAAAQDKAQGQPGGQPQNQAKNQVGKTHPGSNAGLPPGTRALQRMWWNRAEKIEALQLTEDMRKRMDALTLDYFTKQRNSTAQREAFDAFREALETGDWDVARKRAETLAETHAQPLRDQAELMIQVTAMLSKDQREKLSKEFPELLAGPWLLNRGIGANSGQRGRAGGGAAGNKPGAGGRG